MKSKVMALLVLGAVVGGYTLVQKYGPKEPRLSGACSDGQVEALLRGVQKANGGRLPPRAVKVALDGAGCYE